MSTKITNNEKYPSKKKSIEILNVIGSSDKPLTTREIEEQWFEKFKIKGQPKSMRRDSDVYRAIYQLAGFSISKRVEMFYLDDIEKKSDKDFKLKLLRKVNTLFNLQLTKDKIDIVANKLEIKKEQKETGKNFIFSYIQNRDTNISIIIEINNDGSKGSIILKYFNIVKKQQLELKKKSNKMIMSAKINHNKEKGNFIKYILQNNKQKEIIKLQHKKIVS